MYTIERSAGDASEPRAAPPRLPAGASRVTYPDAPAPNSPASTANGTPATWPNVAETWRETMRNAGFDAAVIPAGAAAYRFQDDIAPPFRPNPNFAQWAPLPQAEHSVLLYRPPDRPRLFFYQPADYWYLPPKRFRSGPRPSSTSRSTPSWTISRRPSSAN